MELGGVWSQRFTVSLPNLKAVPDKHKERGSPGPEELEVIKAAHI